MFDTFLVAETEVVVQHLSNFSITAYNGPAAQFKCVDSTDAHHLSCLSTIIMRSSFSQRKTGSHSTDNS